MKIHVDRKIFRLWLTHEIDIFRIRKNFFCSNFLKNCIFLMTDFCVFLFEVKLFSDCENSTQEIIHFTAEIAVKHGYH